MKSKDGTIWHSEPLSQAQTVRRNILRERGGAASFSSTYTIKKIFKTIISDEICDIIIRETNRKGQQITDNYNKEVIEKYPNPDKRPSLKIFKQFITEEMDAFLGILIHAGLHRSNRQNITQIWQTNAFPLIRAAISRDRFYLFLRCIRFDSYRTRAVRAETDKAAPIRDIWNMLNSNLKKGYKPYENITVDEQLFPYRGRTKFTQYMKSKPAKYEIKIFWVCDSKMHVLYKVLFILESLQMAYVK